MLGFESYILNEQLLVFIQFHKWINGKFIGVSSYKDSTSFAFSIMWLFGLEEEIINLIGFLMNILKRKYLLFVTLCSLKRKKSQIQVQFTLNYWVISGREPRSKSGWCSAIIKLKNTMANDSFFQHILPYAYRNLVICALVIISQY